LSIKVANDSEEELRKEWSELGSRDIDGKAFSRASGSAQVNPKCSTAQTRRIKAGIKGTKAREE
jgi:hypothetical protein